MQPEAHWLGVYNHLRQCIDDHVWQDGARLPSQSELGTSLRASRHTIRRALSRLQEEGRVVSWQGRGMYVRSAPLVYLLNEKTRFATNMRALGHEVDVRLLARFERKRPPRHVAKLLGLQIHERVATCAFLHNVNGVPTLIGRHYFNSQRFPDILDHLGETPDVPDMFQKVGVGDYFRASTAIEVRPPNPSESLTLTIPQSQPVMVLLGCNVDCEQSPIEVTEAVVRADRVKLQVSKDGVNQIGDLV